MNLNGRIPPDLDYPPPAHMGAQTLQIEGLTKQHTGTSVSRERRDESPGSGYSPSEIAIGSISRSEIPEDEPAPPSISSRLIRAGVRFTYL
jgi:hypothetical protein